MAKATIPHPIGAPVNPLTFHKVPTKDPFGFIRTDNGELSEFAKHSALLYNHEKGIVHNDLISLLRGGSFGEGVNYLRYMNSSAVTLDETTPVDITALPSRIFFGALNTHDGFLSRHNDLSILFPVILLPNQQNKIIYQQKIYEDEVLSHATVRSLVPSLRHHQESIEFFLQQFGGSTELEIEAIVHRSEQTVTEELLRRIHQLELSFNKTMNVIMTNALATSPSLICHWLMQNLHHGKALITDKHQKPSRFVTEVLTQQLTTFCPSQFRNIPKHFPISDLLRALAKRAPENRTNPVYLVTTATTAELLRDGSETVSIPKSQRVFYLEGDVNSKEKTFKPAQAFPKSGFRGPSELPFIHVDGAKIPIVKIPDQPDKNDKNTSSFVNYVTALFAVPIGYRLHPIPDTSTFRKVDFNAVRMTSFDKGGEDGKMSWYEDVLCRSGLNDPAVYDPREYEKSLLSLEGGETSATTFMGCFESQDAYDKRVFSPNGVTPQNKEFNLCVSNHVIYVNKSFGRTISKNGTFDENPDPSGKFRATGIEGNRPLCTARGYLQSARSAIANMNDISKDAENVMVPFLQKCRRIPFSKHTDKTALEDENYTTDAEVFVTMARKVNLETFLSRELRKTNDDPMNKELLSVLKDVFWGNGISKWMNIPRILFAILEAANLGLFTVSLHTKLQEIYGINSVHDAVTFQETIKRLRELHSAIDTFCSDTMASFAVNDNSVNPYIFYELSTVVPVANIPEGLQTPNTCDDDIPRSKLWIRRMFVETVMNLLATQLYEFRAVHDVGHVYPTNHHYTFTVHVHNNQKRCEKYVQPYVVGGFYTTHEYNQDDIAELELENHTNRHPLLSATPTSTAGAHRRDNFYHSHVSRQFNDLRIMRGFPFNERVVAALACLRPHTPANALAISPNIQTHTAALIMRYGTLETHRLVVVLPATVTTCITGSPPQRRQSSCTGKIAAGV